LLAHDISKKAASAGFVGDLGGVWEKVCRRSWGELQEAVGQRRPGHAQEELGRCAVSPLVKRGRGARVDPEARPSRTNHAVLESLPPA